eukprot:scpid37739/ scgid25807/ Ketohexokinase; Hepatic fructokinase
MASKEELGVPAEERPLCGSTAANSSGMSCGNLKYRFLMTGIACLDIVNVCPRFPEEDEDMRAVGQEWRRGGNASNSSCVMCQLPGARCWLLSTLASDGFETEFVQRDLEQNGVKLDYCVRHDDCRLPTSYVVLSQATGSRTIVHYRKLPNLDFADFDRIPLEHFSWVHFEARNMTEVSKMIEKLTRHQQCQPDQRLTISVEVEKTRRETYPLMGMADVVFISKEVAQDLGRNDAKSAVVQLHSLHCRKDAKLICAWGSCGADGFSQSEGHVHCDAFPPESLVDTLGAGDTFNAGVLYGLESGASLFESIQLGCWLAGRKCGRLGVGNLLDGLSESDTVYSLLSGQQH